MLVGSFWTFTRSSLSLPSLSLTSEITSSGCAALADDLVTLSLPGTAVPERTGFPELLIGLRSLQPRQERKKVGPMAECWETEATGWAAW